MTKTLIKRWESRKGKYFVELYQYHDELGGFSYRTDNGGGNLGNITLEEALNECYKQCRYAPSSLREVSICI